MPWIPELFSARSLAEMEAPSAAAAAAVPYFAGLMSGDVDALVRSFAGVPELHYPVRGRIMGEDTFRRFVAQTSSALGERNAVVEDVDLIVTQRRTVEEVVLHQDREGGRAGLPVTIVAERERDGGLNELRVYFSTWPLNGTHAIRPPLLQPDPAAQEPDVVGEYQHALAAGDTEAVLQCFEPDGYAREPAGAEFAHRGHDGLRAFYDVLFSNGGGIPLEHCTVTDDGRACTLEYNVVWWGQTELPPEAGVAVYVRGESGKLTAARIYDDSDPPLHGV